MSLRLALSVALLLGSSLTTFAQDFEVRKEAEFRKIVPAGAQLQKLAGGFKFVEGPVWTNADGGYLVFSDIPNNELKKWSKAGGIATFRSPSRSSNGNTRDAEGRLITCEHGSRTVTRTEADGTITTLADEYEGKPLNSPNDVVVKSDGSIWFTDPPYGIRANQKEQSGNYVYRLDPKTRQVTAVIKDCDMPNGLCFSPDEKKLYVGDSGRSHHIRVFDVAADGSISGGKVFCVIDAGVPDGIRCDAAGRVWSSAADGAHVFAPDGELIGKILTPKVGAKRETAANLCFGGEDGKTLFLTASTSLYAIQLNVGKP